MIILSNGVRIFINETMNKDIYVGIANFGFENDIHDVVGVSHLLEHLLISFDPSKFIANASTARSYMSFWCKGIGSSTEIDSVRTLTSWFFHRGKLRDDFSSSRIRDHIKELENEYYFRSELFHCMDVLTFLGGGELYNGGRLSMLEELEDLEELLIKRIRRISGHNVVIFVKRLHKPILKILEVTFGSLPHYPSTVVGSLPSEVKGRTVMLPSPFYTVMIKIKPTLQNVLSILCLYETYHLIDYETVGDTLYLTISFINETDYENFLKGTSNIKFDPPRKVNLTYNDDFLMNVYLSFPWISHDILDYLLDVNVNCKTMLESLEQEIRRSVSEREIVAIYPNFSQSMYNVRDTQMHKLAVMDLDDDRVTFSETSFLNLMRKRQLNEVLIRYGDVSLLNFVTFAYSNGDGGSKLFRNQDGIRIQHNFSSDDMRAILESETFLKYSKSKPAAMYQYIFLSFFVTGNSIEDIISRKEYALSFRKSDNRVSFGKKSRYDVITKSSFVCGLLRGQNLSNETLTKLMWILKKKGLIYSLEQTKLRGRKLFYVFMFTIYPDSVFDFLSSKKNFISDYCLIVSERGTTEDFSSLKKNVIIKLC